jgi:hypothetical protein
VDVVKDDVSREQVLRIASSITLLVAVLLSACDKPAQHDSALVGDWRFDSAVERDHFKGAASILMNADGTAITRYKSLTFVRRWRTSDGTLIFTDVLGVAPGPPERFEFSFVSSDKAKLRLKSADFPSTAEVQLERLQ